MAGAFLFVDDDPAAPHALAERLEQLGHEVFREPSGEGALGAFDRTRPDVVVLTLRSPGPASTLAYEGFRRREAALVLLIGPGFAEPDVRAMRLGAEQVLTEPMELAYLQAVAVRVLQQVRSHRRCWFPRVRREPDPGADAFGVSPEMRALAAQLRRLAAADGSTVLLTGEPGTGKGLAARLIHQASRRAPAPFVRAGCAAPDAAALAAELFGAEHGGDAAGRVRVPGLFELADGGTLFLDEIALLPQGLQPDVLAALETRVVRRVGGARAISVDVRPIAATSHDIGAAVRRGQFREDLFFRLKVVPVHLPPVRERAREDREALARGLFAELLGEMPGSPAVLDGLTLALLVAYEWPGNAREMRNVLERALLRARGGAVVLPEHLPPEVAGRCAGEPPPSPVAAPRPPDPPRSREPPRGPRLTLAEVARRHIEGTLRRHEGNRTRAAQELGISRATLINKIRVYGLGEVR